MADLLLTTLRFLHYRIPVHLGHHPEDTEKQEWASYKFGPNGPEIWVDPSLNTKDRWACIVHELVHFIAEDVYGLELTETEVRVLAEATVSVMAQNREHLGVFLDALGTPKSSQDQGLGSRWVFAQEGC